MDIVLIVAAFILYFLYDKNQIQLHQKWLQPSFFLGSFLLAGGIIYAVSYTHLDVYKRQVLIYL